MVSYLDNTLKVYLFEQNIFNTIIKLLRFLCCDPVRIVKITLILAGLKIIERPYC